MTKTLGSKIMWTSEEQNKAIRRIKAAEMENERNHKEKARRRSYLKPIEGLDRYWEDRDSRIIESDTFELTGLYIYHGFVGMPCYAVTCAVRGLKKLLTGSLSR